jgi:type VI secretion system protein ImpG
MERKYYQEELTKIRSLAKQFSNEYPSLAPMLNQESSDPDVERLLEGFAYLTANIHEKIDQQSSELTKSLCKIFLPAILKPAASCVMMQFMQQTSNGKVIMLAEDTELAAKPLHDVQRKFSLTRAEALQPLMLTKSNMHEADSGTPTYEIECVLLGSTLNDFSLEHLEFYVNGEQGSASNLFCLLLTHCTKIVAQIEGEADIQLPPNSLQSQNCENLLGRAGTDVKSFQNGEIIRQYLTFPQQFLRLKLSNLNLLTTKQTAKTFSLKFHLNKIPSWYEIDGEVKLVVNTFAAINVFKAEAKPINLSMHEATYPIRVDAQDSDAYAVYSVQNIIGFSTRGRQNQRFNAIEDTVFAAQAQDLYSIGYEWQPNKNRVGYNISFYQNLVDREDGVKSVSLEVLVSNLNCAETVMPGDVCMSTYTSPENVDYKNLHVPGQYYPANISINVLWKMISLLSLSFLNDSAMADLKQIFTVYINSLVGYNSAVIERKLESLDNYKIEHGALLYHGTDLPGYDVSVTCKLSSFITYGEIYLFGEVINLFYASIIPLNTYIRLTITVSETGDELAWPARTIEKILH